MKRDRRHYQDVAVTAIETALKKYQRVLAVGPTGCGKTVIAARVIERAKGQVLFVAHAHEIIDQTHRRLADGRVVAGVMMAQEERLNGTDRVDPDARVQVASVQTLVRRGVPDGVKLIVFDEAHRTMADSYQRIAESAPRAKVLGLTATPVRMDGKPLSDFFETLVEIAQPSELYAGGYLARPKTYAAPANMRGTLMRRLSGIPTSHGDYQSKALGIAVSTKVLVGNVVDEKIRLAPGVTCVVFACTVAHSRRLVKEFVRRGIKAAHLDADTPPNLRESIIDDLRHRRIEVVCNVNVLTEGWDLPSLGCICIARPTKSLTRFLQMTGRVQRPYGNQVPKILDHGNNSLRLQVLPDFDVPWPSLWDGSARPKDPGAAPVVKACPECQAVIAGGFMECPECGAEQPIDRERKEKEEREARLEELKQKEIDELRARVEMFANSRTTGDRRWVEKAVEALSP